jgi:subtilase family serine protease
MTKINIASRMEPLEGRVLLSTFPGLTPQQVRHAYGFDQVSYLQTTYRHGRRGRLIATTSQVAADGSGQTIAIVDAFRNATIQNDLAVFDKRFGLPSTDAYGRPVLTVATPQGKPPVNTGWASEIALDVEWAHAIAPRAHILLVEAVSDADSDLLAAIDYARRQKGVVAVSMSWGGNSSPFSADNNQYLTTPAGHVGGSGHLGGITFVTSSGDNGAGAAWPASSPNALTIGGTTLDVDPQGNWQNEIGWGGTGGGVPPLETPTTPDVAYNADPNTGFAVYDSTADQGHVGWQVLGGTSAGAPQWAALVAIADQGRAYQAKVSLDGLTQTHPAIYSFSQNDFHDIISGFNGTSAAGPGYDLLTGRGSPKANKVIWDLIGV